MKQNEPVVRPAATVMVVRDGRQDLEVYMHARNSALEFAPGAWVFPGGAVDEADHDPLLARQFDAQAVDEQLGMSSGKGAAHLIAAVRETFEESGLLFAVDKEDRLCRLSADLESARSALCRGEVTFVDVLARHGLQIAAAGLHYFGHWTTPPGETRRYNTRFFVAAAPDGQDGRPDHQEAVEGAWVRPVDILERSDKGEVELITPTWFSLQALSCFSHAAEAVDAAASAPGLVPTGPGHQIPIPGLVPMGHTLGA